MIRARSTMAPEMSAGVITANIALEEHEGRVRDGRGERRLGRCPHAAEPQPGEAADDRVESAGAGRERERVPDERPDARRATAMQAIDMFMVWTTFFARTRPP